MTIDQQVVLVAGLAGALIGALSSFIAQAVLDRARERARGRDAAAMMRAELIRFQVAVATLLDALNAGKKPDDMRGYLLFVPAGTYFDTYGLVIASTMPREWFTEVMAVYARWEAAARIGRELAEKGKLHDFDLKFLEHWAEDADLSQAILLLAGERWWSRRRRWGEQERKVRERITASQVEAARGFEKAGMSPYFAFRPRK